MKAVMASFWQFDPTEGGVNEPQVEAMPARIQASRSDAEIVVLTVRGKPKNRYEPDDSVWLELSDTDAMRLIESLATALLDSRFKPSSPDSAST